MTHAHLQDRPPVLLRSRSLHPPGWQVVLAALGDACARAATLGLPSGFVVGEEPPHGWPPRGACGQRSRVEVQLGLAGEVRVRSVAAPSALLLNTWEDDVRPVVGVCGPTTVPVACGGLLLVCSPGLLEALDPAELIAAPRLLWTAPAPGALLERWLDAAGRHGVQTAAAAVARYVGTPGGCSEPGP